MRPSGAMENEVSSSSMVREGLSSCWAGATPEKKRQEITQRTQRRRAQRARRRERTRQELTQSAQRRRAPRTRRRGRGRRERRKREKNGSEDPPLRIAEGCAWIMVWGGLRRKRGSRDPLWECSP